MKLKTIKNKFERGLAALLLGTGLFSCNTLPNEKIPENVASLGDRTDSVVYKSLRSSSEIKQEANEVNVLKKIVQDCVDSSLERVIAINSLQGGYYLVPKPYLDYYRDNSYVVDEGLLSKTSVSDEDFLFRTIPYYIDRDYHVPSTNVLREQISLGLLYEISSCLNGEKFVEGPVRFGNALIDLDVSNFRADVKILNDRVNVKTYFKVNINFNKRKYELKKFESEIKTNYLALYRLANNITEIQRQSGNEICLTCIAEVLRENNARLYNEEFYENNRTSYTLIYNIFKESPLEGKTEVFSFAHKSYK